MSPFSARWKKLCLLAHREESNTAVREKRGESKQTAPASSEKKALFCFLICDFMLFTDSEKSPYFPTNSAMQLNNLTILFFLNYISMYIIYRSEGQKLQTSSYKITGN